MVKKSQIGSSSPFQQTLQQQDPGVKQDSSLSSALVDKPEPAPSKDSDKTARAPEKVKKKKVSFYQTPDDEDRTRKAWMHTMPHTEHRFITSFYEAAVMAYVEQLEKIHNDGKPFG